MSLSVYSEWIMSKNWSRWRILLCQDQYDGQKTLKPLYLVLPLQDSDQRIICLRDTLNWALADQTDGTNIQSFSGLSIKNLVKPLAK